MYYQNGDLILRQTKKVTGKKIKTDLLWKGEQHHHLVKGKFEIYKDNEQIFLKSKGCVLTHEEHKDLKLPAGIFALSIVNEYDHFLEESRKVID